MRTDIGHDIIVDQAARNLHVLNAQRVRIESSITAAAHTSLMVTSHAGLAIE